MSTYESIALKRIPKNQKVTIKYKATQQLKVIES